MQTVPVVSLTWRLSRGLIPAALAALALPGGAGPAVPPEPDISSCPDGYVWWHPTPAEMTMLMHRKVRNADGSSTVRGTGDQMNIFRDLAVEIREPYAPRTGIDCRSSTGAFTHALEEMPARRSLLHVDAAGRRAVMTVTDVRKGGGCARYARPFFGMRLQGQPATIAWVEGPGVFNSYFISAAWGREYLLYELRTEPRPVREGYRAGALAFITGLAEGIRCKAL